MLRHQIKPELQVQDRATSFPYMPNEQQTQEMRLEAVKARPYNIKYIENPNIDLCMAAVSEDGRAIKHLRNPNEQVCKAAISQTERAWVYIKTGQDVWFSLMKQGGDALKYAPNEYKDFGFCAYALQHNPKALANVPESVMSYELCEKAWEWATDEDKPEVFKMIPEKFRNENFCFEAIELDGELINFVPDRVQQRNPEIKERAAQQISQRIDEEYCMRLGIRPNEDPWQKYFGISMQ